MALMNSKECHKVKSPWEEKRDHGEAQETHRGSCIISAQKNREHPSSWGRAKVQAGQRQTQLGAGQDANVWREEEAGKGARGHGADTTDRPFRSV